MRMGQGVRTGLGHGGITCVLQTQFPSCNYKGGNSILTRKREIIYYMNSTECCVWPVCSVTNRAIPENVTSLKCHVGRAITN